MNKQRKPTGEKAMFDEVWEERQQEDGSHLSEISGIHLDYWHNTPMFINMFAHIINKGDNEDLRLVADNVMLISPQEHFLLHYGTIKQRQQYEQENNCSFQIFYDKQEQLKQRWLK